MKVYQLGRSSLENGTLNEKFVLDMWKDGASNFVPFSMYSSSIEYTSYDIETFSLCSSHQTMFKETISCGDLQD